MLAQDSKPTSLACSSSSKCPMPPACSPEHQTKKQTNQPTNKRTNQQQTHNHNHNHNNNNHNNNNNNKKRKKKKKKKKKKKNNNNNNNNSHHNKKNRAKLLRGQPRNLQRGRAPRQLPPPRRRWWSYAAATRRLPRPSRLARSPSKKAPATIKHHKPNSKHERGDDVLARLLPLSGLEHGAGPIDFPRQTRLWFRSRQVAQKPQKNENKTFHTR